MKYLIILVFCFTLMGCEKVIDYEIPYSEPRITMDARISTGDTVFALAALSSYIMNNNGPSTDDQFEMFLYEDDVMVDKLHTKVGGQYYSEGFWSTPKTYYFYTTDYKPKAGKNYKLETERDGFTTAYGEQLMLSKIIINNWSYDTATTKLKLNFADPANTEDFYRIRVISKDFRINFETPVYFKTSDPTFSFFYEYGDDFEDPGVEKSGNVAFFTDEYFNGKNKELEISLDANQLPFAPDKIEVQLDRISEDLYLFERSKAAQWKSDGFFSEPNQIYNNVQNGFGVVGGLATTKIKIE